MECMTNGHTLSDIIALPIQAAYNMGPDPSDIMYQITVLSHFQLVAVQVRIFRSGLAVMGKYQVIGLKLNVSVATRREDYDIALRRHPPSGYHKTHKVTKRHVPTHLRLHPSSDEHTLHLCETVCLLRCLHPRSNVSGKQVQERMQDIGDFLLRGASSGPPTWVLCIWVRDLGCVPPS